MLVRTIFNKLTLDTLVLGTLIPKQHTSEAFAAFKLVQSLSTAIGFIKLNFFYSQCTMIALFIMAVVGFVVLDLFVKRVDSSAQEDILDL